MNIIEFESSLVNNLNDNTDDDYDLYSDLPGESGVSQSDVLPSSAQSSSELDNSLLDEVHVYGKLLSLERQVQKLISENQCLKDENESLRKSIEVKDRQLHVLKNNISSLYKTAKMELDRRTEEMSKLQSRYDAIVFRRINQIQEERAKGTLQGIEPESKMRKVNVSTVNPVDNTSRVKRVHESSSPDRNDNRHRSYDDRSRRRELENVAPPESTKRARHDQHQSQRPTHRKRQSPEPSSHSRHRDPKRV